MHRSEWFDRLFNDVPEEGDVKIGPIVRAALLSLIDDREKRSQDDVTLIGPPISKDDLESRMPGLEELDEGFNAARLSAIANESLLLYRCTVVDDDWGYGTLGSTFSMFTRYICLQNSRCRHPGRSPSSPGSDGCFCDSIRYILYVRYILYIL
ncbi:hypothetical protein FIBSPDRAFT_1017754 [Athelia psychrophila]|uniref:Uncharacterized protein n=1 Tax=Athelia psychrophila TaxID=1759441 RepID=A0A166L1M9_9AGAM|nr:hypothetical protein FIBSPDRAFT_1017754 [Fibularhizoctonia sp. CBS 109695]